ncbi:MAG: SDR family oxidoreductase [Microbacteriaceae bacterium]|nr:MAG: SDR family oxidoreductase [Microbacteriaceae bacterium]
MPSDSNVSTAPSWAGRSVLVTGGTSGTGFQAAKRLVALGASVVINGRSEERGNEALAALREVSERVALSLGDCANYSTSERVVKDVVAAFGGVDVVVSAGASSTSRPKLFAEMTPDEVLEGLVAKYQARLFPIHAAIPYLKGREDANIVLLTTDAGRHATTGETVVGAYAAGIIQVTKTLAKELSRDRIRVNAVSMTLTAGTRSWDTIFGNEGFQNVLFSKAVAKFPFGGAPTASDVSEAVVFLASHGAAQITGQTISVNGGLSYGGW